MINNNYRKRGHVEMLEVNEQDLEKHLKTFGHDEKTHYSRWKRAHIEAEQQHRFF